MSEVRFGSAAAVTARMPSPIIWNDCPVTSYIQDPAKGRHVFDDFKNSVLNLNAAGATDFASGVGDISGDINWYVYAESDKVADIALQADDDGVLLMQTDGTDADVNAITTGNNVQGVWKTPTAGNAKRFWFEARVKVVTITDSDQGSFVGLSQPGEAKNGGGAMTAGGAAMNDVDYVGFAQLSGDCDDFTLVYNEATSGTAQSSTGLITLAADTWVRVGFKVVTKGQGTYIQWYADGVYLGATYDVNLTNANANWPGATDMDVLLASVAESGASDADGIYVDWVRVAQDY